MVAATTENLGFRSCKAILFYVCWPDDERLAHNHSLKESRHRKEMLIKVDEDDGNGGRRRSQLADDCDWTSAGQLSCRTVPLSLCGLQSFQKSRLLYPQS